MRFGTKAIRVGQEPDPITGAVVPPIHMASTYVQQRVGELKAGWEYARSGNPTRGALERSIAALENAQYGLAFASGMAAETAVTSLVRTGEHIVATKDIYGGTFRLFRHLREKYGIECTYADFTDLSRVEEAFTPNTRLVWIESPSNPTLVVLDIAAVAELAHRHNALLVVDNTFASPYLQTPLDLGADIVLHSTTKYIGGHSDLIGGAVVTNDPVLYEKLYRYQNDFGGVPSPFDCWLTLRGIRTLHVRMEAHCRNAMAVAQFLQSHPKIEWVRYPGLPSHPQHELARKQMRHGFSGMIAVGVRGGAEVAQRFCEGTKIFNLAESLGGAESLIGYPPKMSHASMSAEERAWCGIPDNMVRLSVGLEDVNDLIEDLQQALDSA
jgi:cystathionine beta-lyase/cystathionine gamma-synthase